MIKSVEFLARLCRFLGRCWLTYYLKVPYRKIPKYKSATILDCVGLRNLRYRGHCSICGVVYPHSGSINLSTKLGYPCSLYLQIKVWTCIIKKRNRKSTFPTISQLPSRCIVCLSHERHMQMRKATRCHRRQPGI